ncbi:hypothetical protein V565_274510, partial [Rhizoctonia solani 123E]
MSGLKRKLGANGVEETESSDPEDSVGRAPPKKPYKPFTLGLRINPSSSAQHSTRPASGGQPKTGPTTSVTPTSRNISAVGIKPTQKGAGTETGKSKNNSCSRNAAQYSAGLISSSASGLGSSSSSGWFPHGSMNGSPCSGGSTGPCGKKSSQNSSPSSSSSSSIGPSRSSSTAKSGNCQR